jgi:hypothetical protein
VRRNVKKAKAASNVKAILTDISKSATANKVATKVPETVQDTKVIREMAISNNKIVKTVNNDSIAPLSPSSSGAATPESSTSFTATPCAGGQAVLVPSDSDGLSDTPPSLDATIPDAAKALRKQMEKSRSIAIIGAVIAPRNLKRPKKGRVPLTAAAKKDHNVFKMAGQECDQLLATFAKQKRASCPASPDSAIWKNTNLFFTRLPDPVDNGESSTEDEDMVDIPDLVSDPVSDDFEEIVEELSMNAPDCPVQTPKVTFASANEDIYHPFSLTPEGDSKQRSEDGDTTEQVVPGTSLNHESPLNFLFFPNQAEHVLVLTREEELSLIKLHVAPLVLPASSKEPSRSEKKADKAKQVGITPPVVAEEETEALDVEETIEQESAISDEPVVKEPEVVISEQVSDEPLVVVEVLAAAEDTASALVEVSEDTYLAELLAMPNGCGQDVVTRQQEAELVVLHVRPYVGLKKQYKQSKKLEKAKKSAAKLITIAEVKSINPQHVSSSPDEDTVLSLQSHGNPRRPSPSSGKSSSSSHCSEEDFEHELVIARNTFLGITSLEDFIVQLDYEGSSKTTTKKAVCNAFATVAAEQFEALTGLSPNFDVDRAATSSLEQRKIKLGKTTLFRFLSAIPFDNERVTNTRCVMRAFKQAALTSDKPSEKVISALQAASESIS